MLNPASVFALTELVIEPSVLLTAVPPAFQFQDTKVEPLLFSPAFEPIVKPSESKESTPLTVPSAFVALDKSCFVAPLTESKIWCE